MNHRKMLYGYQFKMGELVVCQREAGIVKRVFTLYLSGFSYQRIADMLNSEHIPFSEETIFWDKHKIKRLLENPRYAGTDGYPPITESDTFQSVQKLIQSKGRIRERAVPEPVSQFRHLMKCDACGTDLLVNAVGGITRLRCQQCGFQLDIPDTELTQAVKSQITGKRSPPQEEPCQPSEEVMRITNAVNRALEHPDDPDHIVSLILQGVSARYDCCRNAGRKPSAILMDSQQPRQMISHITVSRDSAITVHFQTP